MDRTPSENTTDPERAELASVLRVTFEVGKLADEARRGWRLIDENPESVAEHSHRAAILGFLLAHQEGFEDPNLVAAMIVFHDMQEVRTSDADLLQKRYVKIDGERAIADQVDGLGMAGATIKQMWKEVEDGSSEAGIIAKDAEMLEMAFRARELEIKGNPDAVLWMDNVETRLRTESAKQLLIMLREADPHEWWKRICQ